MWERNHIMTFQLPDLTPLIVVFTAAIVLTAAVLTGAVVAFFVRNHAVRVARHEPVARYYGHLVLGH
jgi:hypothetical protein